MSRGPGDAKPFTTPQLAALETELAARREALASTVDELATRLDPRAQAARAADRSRRLFSDAVDRKAEPAARRRAQLVLGAAAVGVVTVVVAVRWLRRR